MHTTAIVNLVHIRNKVLKSLAGSTCGNGKETLLVTHKAIGRTVLNYAALVWSPGTSSTKWLKLQTCHNTALREATNWLLMSPEHYLHSAARLATEKTLARGGTSICARQKTSLWTERQGPALRTTTAGSEIVVGPFNHLNQSQKEKSVVAVFLQKYAEFLNNVVINAIAMFALNKVLKIFF